MSNRGNNEVDFVGNYSTYIRAKDVTISDRRGKQSSCQNVESSSTNKPHLSSLCFSAFIPEG